MKIIEFILTFFLIFILIEVIYCCIAVNRNKDKEIYDDKWVGSLTLIEHFNQSERSQLFFCENHYKHDQTIMSLILCHEEPPSAEEAIWDGIPRKFEKAKVIELEGKYFWQDLSSP